MRRRTDTRMPGTHGASGGTGRRTRPTRSVTSDGGALGEVRTRLPSVETDGRRHQAAIRFPLVSPPARAHTLTSACWRRAPQPRTAPGAVRVAYQIDALHPTPFGGAPNAVLESRQGAGNINSVVRDLRAILESARPRATRPGIERRQTGCSARETRGRGSDQSRACV